MPPGAFRVLSIVVKTASDNASAIASLLKEPPWHRLGMGGGMISFRVRGGAKAAESFCKFCKASKLFTLAENLGGVESLCETPARMTHGGFSREAQQAFDDMIRLSVGIEGIEDLRKDILSALEEACTS
ncbi:hypothetical protein TWF173_003063 [Orbilia oligospora]|nr:hypothetical protein TWF173_003063 [Orbilia oligospora]